MLIALQFYASGVLLQVIDGTTGVDKSTVSLLVHKHGRHIENNHSAYSREITLWDIIIKFPYNARSDWLKQRPLSENKVQVNDIKLAFKFLLRNFDNFDPN